MTTRSRFAHPPADRRILQMFHRMPETAEERRRVYDQLREAGFGGLVTNVSFDKAAKPMFDLLGTPEKDKKLVVYETDHVIPHKELIKESLEWLDLYFGAVQ